jgi:hypothetical protein
MDALYGTPLRKRSATYDLAGPVDTKDFRATFKDGTIVYTSLDERPRVIKEGKLISLSEHIRSTTQSKQLQKLVHPKTDET